MDFSKLIFTGGSGLLGREMKRLVPQALYPERREFDVTDYAQIDRYLEGKDAKAVFHAAAFTSPPKVDKDPGLALDVNIVGTANIVKACMKRGIKLVYVSTDYVFDGGKGMYKEDDPVYPVNRYAWSKLGGECAVRMYANSLIIRTSFGENEFPYEKAFVDQWTSRLPVREVAERIVEVLESGVSGVIHVGGERRTVFDYAKAISPGKPIGKLSLVEVSFVAPKDTSLDTARFRRTVRGEEN
jgi:dTDP-4-dehydrorhamnose reductase